MNSDFAVDRLNSNDKKRLYYALDMKRAQQIYDFYHSKDHYIDSCKKYKKRYTFKGDISITWGGDLLGLSEDQNICQSELKDLLVEALDHKTMFGFCPIKIIKDKKASGGKRAYVPEFGTGAFILVYTIKTAQSVVEFLPYDMKASILSQSHIIQLNDNLDQSTRVFVWPGNTPSITTRAYKSDIESLLEESLVVEELKHNVLDADWFAAHPTIFTQHRPEKFNQSETSENEAFGDSNRQDINPDEPGPREMDTYRRNTHRAIRNEELAKSLNDPIRDGTDAPTVKKVDERTGHIISIVKRKNIDMEPLPIGEELTKTVSYTTVADFLKWREQYWDSVCLQLGIPRSFIDKHTKFKTDTPKEEAMIKSVVDSERNDAAVFYQFLYETMYRKRDDAEILNTFVDLDNRQSLIKKKNSGDDGSLKEIGSAKKKLSKISTMRNRISLYFEEDPFPNIVNMEVLTPAIANKAVTAEEEVNLLRVPLELKKVEANDPLVVSKEEERRLEMQNLRVQDKKDETNKDKISEASIPKRKADEGKNDKKTIAKKGKREMEK